MRCLISFFLLIGWFPIGLLAQPSGIWSSKAILKLDAAHRPADPAKLPEALQASLADLKVAAITQAFPGHAPVPAGSQDAWGRPLVDLSLIYYLDLPADQPLAKALSYLRARPEVAYVEPWYLGQTFYQPNDPFADTTGGFDRMWHLTAIQAREAWDLSRSDSSIVIGVVDAADNSTHPDLRNQLAYNHADPIDGIDNDGDGYLDNYAGWDFGGDYTGSPGDNNPSLEGNPHGLWVAGTCCAQGDNDLGGIGTGFKARYLPIKAAPDDSLGSIFFGYQGIVYAADQGAQIINNSWGGASFSQFGQDVVRYATINRGALVIAAAGNSSDSQIFYPAGYQEVLAVANSSFGDTLYLNSTFNTEVDVSAPGFSILSTNYPAGYWRWGGTSASAPVVAGAAAVVLDYFPQLTPYQAGQRLRVTTDSVYGFQPSQFERMGSGRINLFRALTDPLKPSIRTRELRVEDRDGDGRFLPGDTLLIWPQWTNSLHPATDLELRLTLTFADQFYATVIQDRYQAGPVAMNEKFSPAQPFEVVLKTFVPANHSLQLRFRYEDPATTYDDREFVPLLVNPTWLDVFTPSLQTSVSSQGNAGYNDFPWQQQGLGFRYQQGRNALFEAGLLFGNSSNRVSDRVRNQVSRDEDFSLLSRLTEATDDPLASWVARGSFRDNLTSNSLGITVRQSVFAFDEPAYDDFVLLTYGLYNERTTSIDNLYAGFFTDWDLATGALNLNTAAYDASLKLGYTWDYSGQQSRHFGVVLLSEGTFRPYATNPGSGFRFTNSDKFVALTTELSPNTGESGADLGGADVYQFVSTGPLNLAAQGLDTVAFALVGGSSLAQLQAHAQAAHEAYRCRVLDRGPNQPFMVDSVLRAGEPVVFADQNPGASRWRWYFGPEDSATQAVTVRSFPQPGSYEVTLEVEENGCQRTYSRQLSVSPAVFQQAAWQAQVRLFPNPNHGSFTLSLQGVEAGRTHLTLTDLWGRQLWQETVWVQGVNWEKNLRFALPSGLYLLGVQTQGGRGVYKLQVE
jgi:serine protease